MDTRSADIPIALNHTRRTLSEIQLEQDERLAEWRDAQMHHRILTGMLRRCQCFGYHPKLSMTIKNMIKAHSSEVNVDSAPGPVREDESEWGFYVFNDTQGDDTFVSNRSGDSEGLSVENSPQEMSRGAAFGSNGFLAKTCLACGEGTEVTEGDEDDLIFEFDL